MERYGQDFNRNRYRASGNEMGGRGGRNRGLGGGAGDYGSDFNEFGGGARGRFGSDAGRGGMGGYGGGSYGGGGQGGSQGGSQGGGMSGGYGGSQGGGQGGGYGGSQGGGYGGSQGGYGGYTDYLDDRSGGYGGNWGGQGNQQQDDPSRIRVSEIMTENPEMVTAETTLVEAAKKMRDLDVGIIPVVDSQEGRRLKGVLTDRDIAIRAVAEGRDATKTKVSEVMTTEVETCNKNDSIRDVLDVMQREQVRRVPITDRENRLVGIIAQADVAVDYMGSGDQPNRKRDVARTLRSISEPGEPQRGGQQQGMQASSRVAQGGSTRASQQRNETDNS